MSSRTTRRVIARFRMAPWLLPFVCGAWFLGAPTARAFSDRVRFEEPAGRGGSAGRYFTGSPVDGFACGVCHRGGEAPRVHVYGLPIDGYVPGQAYDVQVTWDNPSIPQGLHLELIGRDGRSPGLVTLLDEASIGPGERCDSLPSGDPAAYEFTPGGRKVLGVEACGASSLRFRFTPPDVADVAFSMSVVSSDNHGSPEGDGVFSVQRVLRRVGEPKRTGDCSLAPSGQRSTPLAAAFVVACALFARRRRLSGRAGRASR